MPQPCLARLAAVMLTLALAACGPGPMRPMAAPIERGTALPPPGLEAPIAGR